MGVPSFFAQVRGKIDPEPRHALAAATAVNSG
jgi:hypothetical protein